MAVGYRYARSKKAQYFISTRGSTKAGVPYLSKFRDATTTRIIKVVWRPEVVSTYYAHANEVDTINHLRQGLLQLEQAWPVARIPGGGWVRLWTTGVANIIVYAFRARQSVEGQQDLGLAEFLNDTSQHLLRTHTRRRVPHSTAQAVASECAPTPTREPPAAAAAAAIAAAAAMPSVPHRL